MGVKTRYTGIGDGADFVETLNERPGFPRVQFEGIDAGHSLDLIAHFSCNDVGGTRTFYVRVSQFFRALTNREET